MSRITQELLYCANCHGLEPHSVDHRGDGERVKRCNRCGRVHWPKQDAAQRREIQRAMEEAADRNWRERGANLPADASQSDIWRAEAELSDDAAFDPEDDADLNGG